MAYTHNRRNLDRVNYAPPEYRKRPVEIRKRLKVDVTAMMYQRLSNGGLRQMRKITHSNMFDLDDGRLLTKAGVEEIANDMQREMLSYSWKGSVVFDEWTKTTQEVNKEGMLLTPE